MRIDANGHVGIGVTNPTYKLDVADDEFGPGSYVMRIENTADVGNDQNDGLLIIAGQSTYNSSYQSSFIYFESPDGNYCGRIKQDGNSSVNYLDASDIRLKENIRPTQYGLNDLMKIQVSDYNYIGDGAENVQTGFIAQQLYTAYPDPVDVGGEDVETAPWGVDYGQLTPLLVKSTQELVDRIEQLEKENAQLQSQNSKLNADYASLHSDVEMLKSLLNADVQVSK